MNLVMTGEKAAPSTVSVCDFKPGRLAIGAIQWGHGGCIKIDQVQLFTAVGVMAGIAGRALAGMRPV